MVEHTEGAGPWVTRAAQFPAALPPTVSRSMAGLPGSAGFLVQGGELSGRGADRVAQQPAELHRPAAAAAGHAQMQHAHSRVEFQNDPAIRGLLLALVHWFTFDGP